MVEFLQNISNILIALQVVLTAVIAAGAWSMRRAFVTRKEFEENAGDISRRLTVHSERLLTADAKFTRIDDRIAAVPSIEAVNGLELAMERLSGDVRVLGQKLEGFDDLHQVLSQQVARMDEFLRVQR